VIPHPHSHIHPLVITRIPSHGQDGGPVMISSCGEIY